MMINEHCSGAELFGQVMWPVNIQVGRKGVTYELILNPIARALGETRKPLYGIEDPELVGLLRHAQA